MSFSFFDRLKIVVLWFMLDGWVRLLLLRYLFLCSPTIQLMDASSEICFHTACHLWISQFSKQCKYVVFTFTVANQPVDVCAFQIWQNILVISNVMWRYLSGDKQLNKTKYCDRLIFVFQVVSLSGTPASRLYILSQETVCLGDPGRSMKR